MSGNTLELGKGVLRKAKIELNRLACSLKFKITLLTVLKKWRNSRQLVIAEKPIENRPRNFWCD